ncbi:MAG TPA: hypothetical protein VFS48_06740 [Solirubrobacterales bacterium]|nr:hypothetical protein [Solirubrobacterales bacterium]
MKPRSRWHALAALAGGFAAGAVLTVLAGRPAAVVPSSPQAPNVSAKLSRMATAVAALSRIGVV